MTVGVKTISDTATEFDGFIPINEQLTLAPRSTKVVSVEIVNNNLLEPDEDFFIILYDLKDEQPLFGENTKTRVTIFDDDKPTTIQFSKPFLQVKKSERVVRLKVMRRGNSEKIVECKIKSEEVEDIDKQAREF